MANLTHSEASWRRNGERKVRLGGLPANSERVEVLVLAKQLDFQVRGELGVHVPLVHGSLREWASADALEVDVLPLVLVLDLLWEDNDRLRHSRHHRLRHLLNVRLVRWHTNQVCDADDGLVRGLLLRSSVSFKHIFQDRIVHDHINVVVFSWKEPFLLLFLFKLLLARLELISLLPVVPAPAWFERSSDPPLVVVDPHVHLDELGDVVELVAEEVRLDGLLENGKLVVLHRDHDQVDGHGFGLVVAALDLFFRVLILGHRG